MSVTVQRFKQNPVLTKHDILPSLEGLKVEGVFNPGVFEYNGKVWLLARVAERPLDWQTEERVLALVSKNKQLEIINFSRYDAGLDLSDPRLVRFEDKVYLSTLSHFRLFSSDDGVLFEKQGNGMGVIRSEGDLECFGMEDARVSRIGDTYYITYSQISSNGVGVGMMSTCDWIHIKRMGMILPPHNKDCVLFEEKIDGLYYCLHRPSGIEIGGNYVWIACSHDLVHWGEHSCLLKTRAKGWDCARVGAGGIPIRTTAGWLVLYHGADFKDYYCLGAALLDINSPRRVIARTKDPIFIPEADYEKSGFMENVVFSNGHIVRGDDITLYYGAADESVCVASLSVSDILEELTRDENVA